MTRQNISDAIGNISDKYLMEAIAAYADSMAENPIEETEMKCRYIKKIAAIALAACLVVALSVTAFASGLFSLDSITRKMDDETIAVVTTTADAAKEWFEYKNAHIDEWTSDWDGEWDILNQYGAYTEAAKAALREIAQKHGLELFTELDIAYSVEELAELMGTSPFLPPVADPDLPELKLGGGTVCGHNSVLSFISDVQLENGKKLFYDFYCAKDGYFLPPAATIIEPTGFTSESYLCNGCEVTISLGVSRSYILAELDGGTVTIFIRAGSKNINSTAAAYGAQSLTMDDLKSFADSIDFTAIAYGMCNDD